MCVQQRKYTILREAAAVMLLKYTYIHAIDVIALKRMRTGNVAHVRAAAQVHDHAWGCCSAAECCALTQRVAALSSNAAGAGGCTCGADGVEGLRCTQQVCVCGWVGGFVGGWVCVSVCVCMVGVSRLHIQSFARTTRTQIQGCNRQWYCRRRGGAALHAVGVCVYM